MKNIAILGSTGSIGEQALSVVKASPEQFRVALLTAHKNAGRLIRQAIDFRPERVIITDESLYPAVKTALDPHSVRVMAGQEVLAEEVTAPDIDLVLTAVVGYCGLKPTINAVKAGKTIALANKETLVVAGELVMHLAERHRASVIPVDSEHSAIFQCLQGEAGNPVEKVILTASGGPFRGKKGRDLSTITKQEALKHPNWEMGAKITIDSATLMNKGLEVIEAKWLFNLEAGQIDVVVHPQSVIHSMVQFEDGSMKAQMGLPDMKLPIQYALSHPRRIRNTFPRFNFQDYPMLTFEKPDTDTFRNLMLAFEGMRRGGNMPCVINAANEVVVEAFLQDRITFLQMPDIIEQCMQKMPFIPTPAYEDYVTTNQETRKLATSLL